MLETPKGGFIRKLMENPVPLLKEILEVLKDIRHALETEGVQKAH